MFEGRKAILKLISLHKKNCQLRARLPQQYLSPFTTPRWRSLLLHWANGRTWIGQRGDLPVSCLASSSRVPQVVVTWFPHSTSIEPLPESEGEVWPDDQATFLECWSAVWYEMMKNTLLLVFEATLHSCKRNARSLSRQLVCDLRIRQTSSSFDLASLLSSLSSSFSFSSFLS